MFADPHRSKRLSPDPGRDLRFGVAWLSGCVLVAGLGLSVAPAVAHDNHADGDASNDWIEGLRNGNGKLCCGNNDCRPLPVHGMKSSPGGSVAVEVEGKWFSVPDGNIVTNSSPDGRAWACPQLRATTQGGFSYALDGVRCLLLPPMTN